jgi:hypothetical protein
LILEYISGCGDYEDDEDNEGDGDDEDDQRWLLNQNSASQSVRQYINR